MIGPISGEQGYAGLCVPKSQIDRLIQATPRVKNIQDLTITAFCRHIGMRDQGRFVALVLAGHTTATKKKNPMTGAMQLYMTKADILACHENFFTLSTMATEFGVDRRTLLARVKTAGIRKFAPNNEDFGYLYRRQDVENLVR